MAKIRLTLSIDCENEQVATKVQEQYLVNLNDLLQVDGVFGVHAEWLAESQTAPPPV
jgi:hypothetical protein